MSSYPTNTVNMATGVKGSDVYATTGDPRVDLSVLLNRGLDTETIRNGLEKILARGTSEFYEDAYVLTFQTRNIRGGKGERELSKDMFEYLFEKYPKMTQNIVLDLIPKFGCWRDLFVIAINVSNESSSKILEYVVWTLRKDEATPVGESISLCAKWTPREGNKADLGLVKALSALLFPKITKFSDRLKAYRKLVAGLNRRLNTTEIKMCAGDWAEIQPQQVSGRCLQKNRKAFLNESLKGDTNTLRHPNDAARMSCREHFTEFFAKASKGELTMNAANVVYPHEVIKNVMKEDTTSRDFLTAQWNAIVAKAREGGALKNSIAMCDFSGSMSGDPILISMALGLLVAELNGTNKILTFDSDPTWFSFREGSDIHTKVRQVLDGNVGQGLSTDFQKAMDLVLADIKARRVRPEDLPKDLIVFTDMGWDQACGSNEMSSYTAHSYRHVVKTAPWQTHIEMIREAFRRAGEDMWGVPFVPPRIVVWNLRAEFKDFHATADQEGVLMLSGWSPSLFKVLQEKGVEMATPYSALRAQLDDPMYDEVRQRVRQWLQQRNLGAEKRE